MRNISYSSAWCFVFLSEAAPVKWLTLRLKAKLKVNGLYTVHTALQPDRKVRPDGPAGIHRMPCETLIHTMYWRPNDTHVWLIQVAE